MMVQGAANASAAGYSKHQSTFPMPPIYPLTNPHFDAHAPPPSTDLQTRSMDSMSRTLKPYSMSPTRKARGISTHHDHTCKRCAHSQRDHLPAAKRKAYRHRSYSSTDSTSSSSDSDSESDSSSYTSSSSSQERRPRGRRAVSAQRPANVVRPRQVSLNPLSMYVPSKQMFIPQGAHIHPAVAPYVQPESIYATSQPATYRQPSQTLHRPSSLHQVPSQSHTRTLSHSASLTPQSKHQSLRITAEQHPSSPPGYHPSLQPTTFRTSPTVLAPYQGNATSPTHPAPTAPYSYQAASPQAFQSASPQAYLAASPQADKTQAISPSAYQALAPSPVAYQNNAASPQACQGGRATAGSPTQGLANCQGQQGIPTTVTSPQSIMMAQSPSNEQQAFPAAPIDVPSEFESSAKPGTDQYEYSAAARNVYPMSALVGVGETIGVGQSISESLYEESTQQMSQPESAIFLPDFRGRSRGVKKARAGCCG